MQTLFTGNFSILFFHFSEFIDDGSTFRGNWYESHIDILVTFFSVIVIKNERPSPCCVPGGRGAKGRRARRCPLGQNPTAGKAMSGLGLASKGSFKAITCKSWVLHSISGNINLIQLFSPPTPPTAREQSPRWYYFTSPITITILITL